MTVVVCAAAALVGRSALPDTPPRPSPAGLDIISAAVATSALAAFVAACSRAAQAGWTTGSVLAPLVAGTVLGTGFVLRQRTVARPLLPLWPLRERTRVGA